LPVCPHGVYINFTLYRTNLTIVTIKLRTGNIYILTFQVYWMKNRSNYKYLKNSSVFFLAILLRIRSLSKLIFCTEKYKITKTQQNTGHSYLQCLRDGIKACMISTCTFLHLLQRVTDGVKVSNNAGYVHSTYHNIKIYAFTKRIYLYISYYSWARGGAIGWDVGLQTG
jgi:hypothetical protein